jgi:hypothetical protein
MGATVAPQESSQDSTVSPPAFDMDTGEIAVDPVDRTSDEDTQRSRWQDEGPIDARR